ncbi:MAG: 50S ribosomal protein L5 [Candidatus Komeilibacteria bacterium RIFCSPLOWO2_01_FULL_53_11]|uniref:Large ribosomal subunit protein uL5 n=1 Tax=Candidatus Komeilibacteria bacterium RIFCSPLOWO2_01_FULL_53_11 TaxID=1798552 RepID=A0A1G2BUE0_9BACT|nr:MAG: 50S ribosomal protein L5 [Candidatus Komeilibacteria bacterium RIFCSPLOWO2_01_FULL_53_11]
MRRFQKKYIDTVAPKMRQAFGYTNTLAIPKIEKVVLNAGLSKGLNDKKYQDAVERTLQRISGQKPVMTKAKKSISNFKIREGMVVGAKVTIRGGRMYDFLDKLVSVALPRMRDFHGLDPEKGFDGHGNFSLGFREHIVFPEIGSDEVENIHGLEVTIATTAKTKDEARVLLQSFGFPFKQNK